MLPHYRVPLFARLRALLAAKQIELTLVVGQPTGAEARRGDSGQLGWETRVTNRYWATRGIELVWQPIPKHLRSFDLVIVEQANRLLVNYALLVARAPLGFQLAYWGHGRNFQRPRGLRERLKRRLVNVPDWWFAYNDLSARVIAEAGFPAERITVVQNAIDTDQLRADLASISELELQTARESLGIRGNNTAIFCGGLYDDKKLPFLFEAADRISNRLPDFCLLIVGGGPRTEMVAREAASRQHVRFLGPKFGREKALYLRMSKLQLIPGLVGLGILDSFAAGCPLVTTDVPIHSPEISYLRPGENGVMTPHLVGDYASAVVELLKAPDRLRRLTVACTEDAGKFSIQAMASNFALGIENAIASAPRDAGSCS